MESNKSKVEETMITGIIAKHMGYANQTSVVNAAHEVLEYVKSLTSLAHPQQSEGVGRLYDCKGCTNFPVEVEGTLCRYCQQSAEGVGTTDSICGDLKDRQAAEGDDTITDKANAFFDERKMEFKPFYALLRKDFLEFVEAQPSEPAALKEFYCIGDKDNLFQCEEQCEDCKKGAALKDGEITDGEIEGTIRQLWEKWQFEGKVFYHEFEFALEEFASLLTNHKS